LAAGLRPAGARFIGARTASACARDDPLVVSSLVTSSYSLSAVDGLFWSSVTGLNGIRSGRFRNMRSLTAIVAHLPLGRRRRQRLRCRGAPQRHIAKSFRFVRLVDPLSSNRESSAHKPNSAICSIAYRCQQEAAFAHRLKRIKLRGESSHAANAALRCR
jgi:hypothetical protein